MEKKTKKNSDIFIKQSKLEFNSNSQKKHCKTRCHKPCTNLPSEGQQKRYIPINFVIHECSGKNK